MAIRKYTDEERKQRKKIYDNKYQNKRYKDDEEYRKIKITKAKLYYKKKRENK